MKVALATQDPSKRAVWLDALSRLGVEVVDRAEAADAVLEAKTPMPSPPSDSPKLAPAPGPGALESLALCLPDAFCWIDAEGHIEGCNSIFMGLVSLDITAMRGRPLTEVLARAGGDEPLHWHGVFPRERRDRTVIELRHGQRWLRLSAMPRDDRVGGWFVLIADGGLPTPQGDRARRAELVFGARDDRRGHERGPPPHRRL